MTAKPIVEEINTSAQTGRIAQNRHVPGTQPSVARPLRRLAIYSATDGFDLVQELDHLSTRTIEPNIFFSPRFLAPAMPRLEDREVRLAVVRDGLEPHSRLRLLMPYSVERAALPFSALVFRSWANPYAPLGTPLIDKDDPYGVMEDFLSMLARPHLRMPKILVFPDMRLDGPAAEVLRTVCKTLELPLTSTKRVQRPFLKSALSGGDYLKSALRPHHMRDFGRLKRRLGEKGNLEYKIATQPDAVRLGVEAFLSLEMAGWKGRRRSAMATDRYGAAFAREATLRLAEAGHCAVHILTLDDRPIAVLIAFRENGVAYTWKTAYDESLAQFSPGTLLALEVTRSHLSDPDIRETDSCAVPDHPVMSRIWSERVAFGTLLLGLDPQTKNQVEKTARNIEFVERARSQLRGLRGSLAAMNIKIGNMKIGKWIGRRK